MGFAAIIIGDEILRGKRQDGHFAKIRQLLSDRGMTYYTAWCQENRRSFDGSDIIYY